MVETLLQKLQKNFRFSEKEGSVAATLILDPTQTDFLRRITYRQDHTPNSIHHSLTVSVISHADPTRPRVVEPSMREISYLQTATNRFASGTKTEKALNEFLKLNLNI